MAWVKRQRKYNLLKTEAEFLHRALERFISEKTSPEKWAAIKNRRRFTSRSDFDVPPNFRCLVWLNATAEVMEDGSEWVAVITKLGEIQEDLWLELSTQLIHKSGYEWMITEETERLRVQYIKLLENGRVDERFINVMAVQSVVKSLASRR